MVTNLSAAQLLQQRMRFGHIMRGSYIKPNMFVSTLTIKIEMSPSRSTLHYLYSKRGGGFCANGLWKPVVLETNIC